MLKLEPHVGHKTHIIWDWNGTLLDDVEICIASMRELLGEHGLPDLDRARYLEVFRFPVREYYVDLGFDFQNKHSFEHLSVKFVDGYARRIDECDLHEGARDLLKRLKDAGKKQAILSAAPEQDLISLLEKFQIRHFFDEIYGLSNIYAAGKLERGRDLMHHWGVEPGNIVLVGDTEHDLEVAHALGVDVILLDKGHQSVDRLISRKAKTFSR